MRVISARSASVTMDRGERAPLRARSLRAPRAKPRTARRGCARTARSEREIEFAARPPHLRAAIAAGAGQHEPFGFEHAQRLAHGGAAQSGLRDQFTFGAGAGYPRQARWTGSSRAAARRARPMPWAQQRRRGPATRGLLPDDGAPLWALAGRVSPSAYYLSNKIIRPKREAAMPGERSRRARGDRHRRRNRGRRRDRVGIGAARLSHRDRL